MASIQNAPDHLLDLFYTNANEMRVADLIDWLVHEMTQESFDNWMQILQDELNEDE
jgi:hypothetical protein